MTGSNSLSFQLYKAQYHKFLKFLDDADIWELE
jgi:hypothetical protein